MPSLLDPPPGAGYFAGVSVDGLASDLRAGRASPRDLVERALGEARRWQPVVNAFVMLDEPGAKAAADQAAEELAAGTDRGPLHGIPVAIKDLIDVQGLPTTAGARHFADHVAARDAECVRRLREAGAIIVGKTTTHEFAYGPTGDRSAHGPTRNPYAPDHMAGGSSCGSAAAVAAGVVPLAIGTDTGGSVRIPAACCGVVGLKSTFGTVPVDGVFPLAPSLDTVGPLARTPADCRLLWTAMTTDGTPSHGRPGIGWVPPDLFHPTASEVTRLVRDVVGEFVTGDVTVPEGLWSAYAAIQSSEAYAVHTERLATSPDLYGDETRERLQVAGEIRGWEYVRAQTLRDRARETVLDLFEQYDFLALPTIPLPPPPVDSREEQIGGETINVRVALLSLTSPWNLLGLPAISVPAGLVDGLPVGLQLVGPPGAEHRLLTAPMLDGLG